MDEKVDSFVGEIRVFILEIDSINFGRKREKELPRVYGFCNLNGKRGLLVFLGSRG